MALGRPIGESTDLALFAVGWKLCVRDLSVGLSSEVAESVQRVLVTHGVDAAFVLRDNLVNYKKVLLGIFRDAGVIHRDLRRLATFFREPPTSCEDAAFLRSSRHRELCDALSTTAGALAGVHDARRFCKAICCVPRHPDAPRSMFRPFGQPLAHYRCAGLLSEPLPGSMKGWRLLREACDAFRHQSVSECLETGLASGAQDLAAVPPAQGRFDEVLSALNELGLPADANHFVRCVVIARGGAKALQIRAETLRLVETLRVLLRVCTSTEEAISRVASAGASTEAEHTARAAELKDPAPTSDGTMPRGKTRGHPAVASLVLAKKHAFTLRGLRASVASTLHWLTQIAEGNPDGRIVSRLPLTLCLPR